jgi:spore maturation protein CgeB
LCAERTVEHLALYQENTEALFWRDALECSQVTKQWLENPADLSAVAKAGRARLAERDLWNESVLRSVLSALSDR